MLSGTLVKIFSITLLLSVAIVLALGIANLFRVDQIKHQIN